MLGVDQPVLQHGQRTHICCWAHDVTAVENTPAIRFQVCLFVDGNLQSFALCFYVVHVSNPAISLITFTSAWVSKCALIVICFAYLGLAKQQGGCEILKSASAFEIRASGNIGSLLGGH